MSSKTYSKNGLICLFMVPLMLVMQLALAQHTLVHFSPESHSAPTISYAATPQNTGTGEQKTPDKFCQFCLFAKSFSQTLMGQSPLIIKLALMHASVPPSLQLEHAQAVTKAYRAQAPPALS